jgi:hypothetical protein
MSAHPRCASLLTRTKREGHGTVMRSRAMWKTHFDSLHSFLYSILHIPGISCYDTRQMHSMNKNRTLSHVTSSSSAFYAVKLNHVSPVILPSIPLHDGLVLVRDFFSTHRHLGDLEERLKHLKCEAEQYVAELVAHRSLVARLTRLHWDGPIWS